MNLKQLYDNLLTRRSKYLDYACETAQYTLPNLDVEARGAGTSSNQDTSEHTIQPHTTSGTQAVRSLASFLHKTMMPPNVSWLSLKLSPIARALLRAQNVTEDTIKAFEAERLVERGNQIIESLQQKVIRSRGASLFRRSLVEGNTLIINRPTDIEVIPLRSFVTKRVSGIVRLVVYKRMLDADPLSGEASVDQEPKEEYTLIDYAKREVHRAIGDATAERVKDEIEGNVDHYFVFVNEVPDVGDYEPGYAWYYLNLIKQLDHGESSLGEAMFIAGQNRPVIREGSTLARNPAALSQKRAGEPWVGNAEDITWVGADNKLRDWAFVAQLVERKHEQLGNVFAMGIKDRPSADNETATKILQMIDEINTQTQDLLAAVDETCLRPLVRSELELHEIVDPLFANPEMGKIVGGLVAVVITTGTSAIEKQRSLVQFVRGLLILRELDPYLMANGKVIADQWANTMLLPTEGMYDRLSPEEVLEIERLKAMGATGGAPLPEGQPQPVIGANGAPQPGNPNSNNR